MQKGVLSPLDKLKLIFKGDTYYERKSYFSIFRRS